MLKQYVGSVHPRIETLMMFHKRPLTVVYNQGINLPSNLVKEKEPVAVRVVQDSFCKNLIRSIGKPLIVATANLNGEPFPSIFGEISSAIIQGVDYVAQHRRNDKAPKEPSIIVKYDNEGELVFLRD